MMKNKHPTLISLMLKGRNKKPKRIKNAAVLTGRNLKKSQVVE